MQAKGKLTGMVTTANHNREFSRRVHSVGRYACFLGYARESARNHPRALDQNSFLLKRGRRCPVDPSGYLLRWFTPVILAISCFAPFAVGEIDPTVPVLLSSGDASESRDDAEPQVATDGRGNWLAVWYTFETLGGTVGTDSDIVFSTSTDNGGSWTEPALLNTNGTFDSGSDFSPQIATDGAGNWLAVWESDDTLDGTVGADNDIFVSISTDNGLT